MKKIGRFFILSCILLLLITPQHAVAFLWPTNIFEDQFERGNLEFWTGLARVGEGVNIEATKEEANSGIYAGKCGIEPSNTRRMGFLVKSFAQRSTVYARCFYYFPTSLTVPTNGNIEIFSVAKSGIGNFEGLQLKKNNKGHLVLVSKRVGESTNEVLLNRWHCVELSYTAGQTNGRVQYWLDGAKVIDGINTNFFTYWSDEIRIGCVEFVYTPSTYGTYYFDDAIIASKPIGYKKEELKVMHPDFQGRIGAKVVAVTSGTAIDDRLKFTLIRPSISSNVISDNVVINRRVELQINLRGLPKGPYELEAALMSFAGVEKSRYVYKFEKTYDGDPELTIDENNNIVKNNELFFPVTPFALQPSHIANWKSQKYINMLYGCNWNARTPTGVREYVQQGGANGLGTWAPFPLPDANRGASNEITTPLILSYITNLATDTNVSGWVFADEPEIYNYRPEDHYTWWRGAKSVTTKKLTHVNLMGLDLVDRNLVAQDWCYPFLVADIYGFDTYPIEYTNNMSMEKMALAAERLKNWNYDLVPFWAYVQTCDVHPGAEGPGPTPQEIKMMSWMMVAKGAKGIQWFHYFGTTPVENFAAMSEFTRDIEGLTPYVLGKRLDAFSGNTNVLVFANRNAARSCVILVNLKNNTQSATLSIPNFTGTRELAEYKSANRLTIQNGTFTTQIPPYGVRVFIGNQTQLSAPNNLRKVAQLEKQYPVYN